MDDHRQHLSRGFNWLGIATVAAKVIDFSTMLAVLGFLTKPQVGEASIVIAVGMVVEALNGLGTSEALIQAQSVHRSQLDALFWYILGAGTLVGALTLLAAPAIIALYGMAGAFPLFCAIALKQPAVGAAVIPLALMNRDLQYRRIAGINLCATFAAAATRLGLAAAGAGAGALVIGYVSSGVYILIGTLVIRPFRPVFRYQAADIRPLMRFGLRAAFANLAEQTFKNVDFLLIGWFYGAASLAVYRLAFDVAMEPTMAVGTLVNRIALPVFARVAAVPAHLADIFVWSMRRIAILVAPLMVGLILIARPLTQLVHDHQGHSYVQAAVPLQILAAAALLRVMAQLLPTVMLVSGRPGDAAWLALTTLLLLTTGIAIAGASFAAHAGIIAVSVIWLVIYPPILLWGMRYLRRNWSIRPRDLARSLTAPLTGIAVMICSVELVRRLIGPVDLHIQIAVVIAATAIAYAGLVLNERSAAATLPRQ